MQFAYIGIVKKHRTCVRCAESLSPGDPVLVAGNSSNETDFRGLASICAGCLKELNKELIRKVELNVEKKRNS